MATIQAKRPFQVRRAAKAALAGTAIIAAAAAAGYGGANALWHDQEAAASQLTLAESYVEYGMLGETFTVDADGKAVRSLSDQLVDQLARDGAIAIPIDATHYSEGAQAIWSLLHLELDPSSPIAQYGEVAFTESDECAVPERPAMWDQTPADGSGIYSPFGDTMDRADAVPHTGTGCLTIALPTSIEPGGVYSNVGTVTSSSGTTGQSQWEVVVDPPVADWAAIFQGARDGGIDITPDVTMTATLYSNPICHFPQES